MEGQLLTGRTLGAPQVALPARRRGLRVELQPAPVGAFVEAGVAGGGFGADVDAAVDCSFHGDLPVFGASFEFPFGDGADQLGDQPAVGGGEVEAEVERDQVPAS